MKEEKAKGMGKQIYFDSVAEGQEIPSYSLQLDGLRMHLQTSGTADFHRIHCDEEFVRKQGAEHTFVNTGFTGAALSRVLTDWMGDEGWLQKFEIQMRKMNHPGDTMTMKATVVKKYVEGGKGFVDCEVLIENQRVGVTTTGKATVILPFQPK